MRFGTPRGGEGALCVGTGCCHPKSWAQGGCPRGGGSASRHPKPQKSGAEVGGGDRHTDASCHPPSSRPRSSHPIPVSCHPIGRDATSPFPVSLCLSVSVCVPPVPPQEAIMDGTEIAVSPRSLHSELMCPICLDMLKNTMTTKECLHRFCSDCIVTALRSGYGVAIASPPRLGFAPRPLSRFFGCFFFFTRNKECPTCRKKLVSKRSLRPDPNFDALISKIYPSRDEYEAHQDRVLAKLSRLHNQQALSSSIEEGLKMQAMHR